MNNSWKTKADVLRDLGAVNGRRTGAEDLHRHVVAGERPPPIHHEIPDEDEMSYFSGGLRASARDCADPDLAGISSMLKMVNDMDETVHQDETVTLYRNRATDEISISKLNPNAGEYVPGGNFYTKPPKHSPNKKNKRNSRTNTIPVNGPGSSNSSNSDSKGLPSFNNMFKSKSDKEVQELSNNATNTENVQPELKTSVPPGGTTQNGIAFYKSNIFKRKSDKEPQERSNNATKTENMQPELKTNVDPIGTTKNGIAFHNSNMFKSKSDKEPQERSNNAKNTENMQPELKTNVAPIGITQIGIALHKSKCENDKLNVTVNSNTTKVTEIRQPEPQPEPKLLINGLPKRQIEKDLPKADNIKEIQEKIKSSIIASSTDNSLQTKRQKNVAIATLLKLGMIPAEKPKLIKPEYFEKPPTNDEEPKEQKVENLASTSSSETNDNYIDPDSISKVDSWFSSMESPKPRPQLQEKLPLKDCITFKKKTASSVTSRNTSTSKDDKESPKQTKAFKPSVYASDLLKKYETNAQHQPLIEDLGTRLERQLKERDEVIKQKMLARQNAG